MLLLALPSPVAANPQLRRFTIDAKQFEYAPGRVEVNVGDERLEIPDEPRVEAVEGC